MGRSASHRFAFLKTVFFFVSLLLANQSLAAPKDPLSLGAIVSLSGDAARNGRNWLEGAELAIDELNQSGVGVRLVVEDDATVPGKVATAFVKLATVDKVSGIIGGTWDFLAESAFPLAKQYRTPFITPTNPVEILSAAARSNQWVFTNGLSLSAEEQVLRQFLKMKAIRSVGLVYINVPYGISHADLLRKIAKDSGVDVLTDTQISYEGFHDVIKLAALKIFQKKPELVLVVLNYEGVDLLLRELAVRHSTPLVVMPHTLKEAYDFAEKPDRYGRAYGIYPKYASNDFDKTFLNKFNRAPYDYAAAGYDATMFMANLALRRGSGDLSGVKVVYEGVTGMHAIPAADRSVVSTRAAIMSVVDGRLQEFSLE